MIGSGRVFRVRERSSSHHDKLTPASAFLRRRGLTSIRVVLGLVALCSIAAGAVWQLGRVCCAPPPITLIAPDAPSARPDDFSIDVAWSTGSVAPRYYQRQRARIGADRKAHLTYVPGYDADGPSWDESFVVSDSAFEALWTSFQHAALRRLPAAQPIPPDRHAEGGGSHSGTVVANGAIVAFDDYRADEWSGRVTDFVARVQRVIPDSIRDRLTARHKVWSTSKFGDQSGAKNLRPE